MVNCPRKWSSFFNGKKPMKKLNIFDARTFQYQIAWNGTTKAASSGYDYSDNAYHKYTIQVLRLVKTYHFNNVCVCFVKDAEEDGFIEKLKVLPFIFNDVVYDLTKMDERNFKDHVMQTHEVQKSDRAQLEKANHVEVKAKKVAEEAAKKKAENEAWVVQKALEDATKVIVVLIDLTIFGTFQENDELATSPAESIFAQADEVVQLVQSIPASKQSKPLSEATSTQKDVPNAIVVFTNNSDVAPINFVVPGTLSRDRVQELFTTTRSTAFTTINLRVAMVSNHHFFL